MELKSIDWTALERLRRLFLEGHAGASDYWRTETDLASYNQTFAQRIGWKWDHVLSELYRRHWTPPAGEAWDWGCGSGIAGRAFLNQYGADSVTALGLWDRSPLARQFAASRAREKYPRLSIHTAPEGKPGLLLVSHVLTELAADQLPLLMRLAHQATAIIWIEPGTYEASRALMGIREQLRSRFALVAPCPHQDTCGLLAPGQEKHWCHHFAVPPPGIHADSASTHFAKLAGIDLRSLPLSYLVLDQRAVAATETGTVRILGRPRIYKGYGLLFGCHAGGVADVRLTRRRWPEAFRQLRKGELPLLQRWRVEDGEIVELTPVGRIISTISN